MRSMRDSQSSEGRISEKKVERSCQARGPGDEEERDEEASGVDAREEKASLEEAGEVDDGSREERCLCRRGS
jgi:hypothetical protein